MGSCLCKSHKELHLPMTARQGQSEEGQPTAMGGSNPSNGGMTDKSNGYDIGELATSSLLGLVATIKERITKPTAMAQGRVAHLIEWKGWGGGGREAGGGWTGGWSRAGGGWGGTAAGLHEDEQFYSQMTDEIKEARFAAGVAEQFALAEAAMNVWSMNDCSELPSTSMQGAESHFLSQFLLDGGRVGVPQHLYSVHALAHNGDRISPRPQNLASSVSPMSISQQNDDRSREDGRTVTAEANVRHVDSSSLSEDDVFYN